MPRPATAMSSGLPVVTSPPSSSISLWVAAVTPPAEYSPDVPPWFITNVLNSVSTRL